ncbi:MAG: dolichyl-phosphate beta-glucosyltransferase [Patescibacteria group bacterium]
MRISLIIPAYNEAPRLGPTLEAVKAFCVGKPWEAEIIVVDNASSDSTTSVARSYGVTVIAEPLQGKGAAVRAGMRAATGDIQMFLDADHSTSIDHLPLMLERIERGADVVIGSLAVPGARILAGGHEPWWRVVAGKLGNIFIQVLAVPGIWDTQRGFKVFTRRAADAIFPKLHIVGWGFDVEVLAIARALGYRIDEAPVAWKNHPATKITSRAYIDVLYDVCRIAWWRLTRAWNT